MKLGIRIEMCVGVFLVQCIVIKWCNKLENVFYKLGIIINVINPYEIFHTIFSFHIIKKKYFIKF